MARPKKDKNLRHTRHIMLRLTNTEYEIIAENAKAAREQVMICPMVMHPAMIKEFNMNRRSGTVRNALIKLEKVGFLGKRFNSVVNSSLEGISAILMA